MRFLLALLILAPAMGFAQSAEWWNPKESVLNVTGKIGFSAVFTGNATPVSFTLPSNATRCVRFDPVANFWACADVSGSRICGSARPTTTVSQTAWEFNPNQRRFQAVSGSVPDTLWVQADASNTQVIGHWYVCQ